jgi:hypothetical protein
MVKRRKCCPLMRFDLTDLFMQTEIDLRFNPRIQIYASSQVMRHRHGNCCKSFLAVAGRFCGEQQQII